MTKTFSLLRVLLIILLALAAAKPANANWYVNNQGWLVYQTASEVLGDEDSAEDEDKEGEDKEDKKKKEDQEKKDEQTGKSEVEYFDAGQNAWFKVKTEEGKMETEIKRETNVQNFQLKLRSENGTIKLEAESEDGEETELGEDDEIEIEPDEDDDKIRVAAGSGDGEMVFSRNRVRARTNFPLAVDLNTNELIVTTPNGVKRVTILPDQAINNLLSNDVIDRVKPETEEELELVETEDGTPAYEVAGESDQEFLGFLPVKIKAKFKVSAETGEVLSSEKPLVTRLLDLLSF